MKTKFIYLARRPNWRNQEILCIEVQHHVISNFVFFFFFRWAMYNDHFSFNSIQNSQLSHFQSFAELINNQCSIDTLFITLKMISVNKMCSVKRIVFLSIWSYLKVQKTRFHFRRSILWLCFFFYIFIISESVEGKQSQYDASRQFQD